MIRLDRHPFRKYAGRGITVIEVLILIGLVSLAFALLIPAVQSAREAARRSQCVCHLAWINMGVMNYESTFGHLPPAGTLMTGKPIDSFSVHARLLPFIEQHHIANALNFEISPGIQTTVTHAIISHFAACPSDPLSYSQPQSDELGHSIPFGEIRIAATPAPVNYGVNLGSWIIYDPADGSPGDGAFAIDASLRLADFTDGTLTTIGITEGISYQPVLSANSRLFAPGKQPPVSPADVESFSDRFDVRGGHISWAIADPLQTGMTITFPPNAKVPFRHHGKSFSIDYINNDPGESTNFPTYAVITPRSYHKGGVNAAMMDGSVRLIRNTIDLQTFRALGTRAGREPITDDDY